MANVEVKEFKIEIGKKEYTFRLDFKALIKYSNRYENGIEIFNNFLQNKDIYGCVVKILSCACAKKDFTENELETALPFNLKTMKIVDEVTMALIEGIMGEKSTESTSEVVAQEKNELNQQGIF